MNKRGVRTCCVCHKEYSFCLCNPEDRNKPTWYFAYCSENCKDIYTVTSDYEDKKISADYAKKQLDKLDLSQIANFGESYQKATNIETAVINGKTYINSMTLAIDSISSEDIRFYKVDESKNYTYPNSNNKSVVTITSK